MSLVKRIPFFVVYIGLDGSMDMDISESHSLNTVSSIFIKESDKITVSRALQPEKAPMLIQSTLLPRVTEVRDLQSMKA